jgi:N utilization substance protein B
VSGSEASPLGDGGTRHEARERAFHLLYESEIKQISPADLLAELPLRPDQFAVELVEGVAAHAAEIDQLVGSHAHNWHLDRMPALDRAVLRLGAFELVHRPDVPTGAVINEAVELASQYSTDDSGRFVNGVLSAIAREVRTS